MSRIRTLSIREQAAWVRSRFPSFTCQVDGGLLFCAGAVQPGPVSSTYDVRLVYRVGTWPKVFVPGGQLKPLEPGGKIPHAYGPTQPCVFYPSIQEWRSDLKLSDTVIPWLCLWLSFYEMWRATGEWLGGGIPYAPAEEREPAC
jgi:hypothetical protein